ncbi:MAG: hypothetical protein ABH845_00100, partial [Candidatus Omnitrophota bacterium]
GMNVTVQRVGKTLGVYVPLEKLFDSTLRLSPEVGDQLDGVILSTSRVVLSTNDPPDFYVVVAQDKRIPGIELKLIRYVQDLRRFWLQDLSRGEFNKRMLFEFGLDLGIFKEGNEHFNLEEVHFEQFLAQQMAFRIKMRLEEEALFKNKLELRTVKGKFVEAQTDADGKTQGKPAGDFALSLDVQDRGFALRKPIDAESEKKIFALMLDVVLEVFRGYHFEAFRNVTIQIPYLHQNFVIGRDDLERYRHKKMDLAELLLPKDFNLSPYDAELLLKK